jgi:hypothetical protein
VTTVEPPVVAAPPPASTQPKAKPKPAAEAPKPLVPARHRGPLAALAAAGASVAAGVGWLAAGPAGVGVAAGVVGAGAGAVVMARRRKQDEQVKADPSVKAAEKAAAKLVKQLTGQLGRIPGVRSMPGVRQALARQAAARNQTPRPGAPGRGPGSPAGGSRPGAGPGSGRSSGRGTPGAGRGSSSRAGRSAKAGPGGSGRPGGGAASGDSAGGGRRGVMSRVTPSGRRAAKAARAAGGSGSPAGTGSSPKGGKAPKDAGGAGSAGSPAAKSGWRSRMPGSRGRSNGAAPKGDGSGSGPSSPGKAGKTPPAGGGKAPGPGSGSPPAAGGPGRKRRKDTAPDRSAPKDEGGRPSRADRRRERRGDDTQGWEKRPARQRRASEDHAARRDAEKQESKDARRQAKGSEAADRAARKRQNVQPDEVERAEPAQPQEPQEPQGQSDKRPAGPDIWASRALQARDREVAERDRFAYRRPAGASGAGLVDDPAPRGTHHDRSLKDTAQRRHDDVASARYQQELVDRGVAAKRKAEWDAQEPRPAPPRHSPPGRSRRADLNDSQWDINDTRVPATGRHAAREGTKGTGMSGEIQSMREDFPRVIATGQQVIEDAVTSMRQQVAAAIGESPSSQAVKDLADQWAKELEALAARGDEITALSRQADQVGYDAADLYGADPHRHAWLG